MTNREAWAKHDQLVKNLGNYKLGTKEHTAARLNLIHFEREVIADNPTDAADELFPSISEDVYGSLCDYADSLGTSSIFDDSAEIAEFRKEYIDWFRSNRLTEIADELEEHLNH